MRCVVVDVAAESGGALVVSDAFQLAAADSVEHEWIFHVSRSSDIKCKRMKVRVWRWVKRSWFHRLFFDLVVLPKEITKENPDVIVSLQNTGVVFTTVPQVLYVHQAIPFSSFKFSILRDPKLWVYQNIIKHFIFASISRAETVVVQTQWMKDAVITMTKTQADRVVVVRPGRAGTRGVRFVEDPAHFSRFFYPARAQRYKNHRTLIEACRILERNGNQNVSVVLSMTRSEFDVLGLGEPPRCVHFVGWLSADEVSKEYSRSVLVFPSKLESLALPPIEARDAGCLILAADLPFCHETLDDYANGYFFPADSGRALAELMLAASSGKFTLSRDRFSSATEAQGWGNLIEVIERAAELRP